MDPKTKEASKIVKLATAAMGNTQPARRNKFKRNFRKGKDPLRTFTAEVSWLIVFNLWFYVQFCEFCY